MGEDEEPDHVGHVWGSLGTMYAFTSYYTTRAILHLLQDNTEKIPSSDPCRENSSIGA